MTELTPETDLTVSETPSPGRRSFFARLTALTGVLATGFLGLPLIRYFTGLTPSREEWIPLGKVLEFPAGETRLVTFENPIRQPWDGHTARTGVYVRRQESGEDQPRFLILTMNCAHLGCPVTWFPQSGLFLCPCHGGVYDANGERASGPPPRGLFHCVWRVTDGELQVRAPHFPTLQDPEADA